MSSYILLTATCGRAMQIKGVRSLLAIDSGLIIDHQIKTILEHDNKADITFVTGVGHDKIVKHILDKKYDIRIVYNHEYRTNSQTDSLRLAINAIRASPVYIIHGDIIFTKDSLKVRKSKSTLMIDKEISEEKSVGVSHSDGIALNLSYGLKEKWAQIAYIASADFDECKRCINSFKNNRLTFEFLNLLGKSTVFYVQSKDVKTAEVTRNYEKLSHQQQK